MKMSFICFSWFAIRKVKELSKDGEKTAGSMKRTNDAISKLDLAVYSLQAKQWAVLLWTSKTKLIFSSIYQS